jgi:tRNA (cytidine/uridine-2'-O-)-methyltransferase
VFRVLFYSPRIAPNTGNAIRMVAATGSELHLVEPLGFDLSEPKLRRAGLDYHDLASVTVHKSLPAAWQELMPARVFAFTAHADSSFADVAYLPGDVLMFGPEPTGLDSATLADSHITRRVRIPMLAGRRSLNLSNAAAIAVYEAWRQHGFTGAFTGASGHLPPGQPGASGHLPPGQPGASGHLPLGGDLPLAGE